MVEYVTCEYRGDRTEGEKIVSARIHRFIISKLVYSIQTIVLEFRFYLQFQALGLRFQKHFYCYVKFSFSIVVFPISLDL